MAAKPRARTISIAQDWDGQFLNAVLVALHVIDEAGDNGDQERRCFAEYASGLLAGVLRKNVSDDEMSKAIAAFKYWPKDLRNAYPEVFAAYCAAHPIKPQPRERVRLRVVQ